MTPPLAAIDSAWVSAGGIVLTGLAAFAAIYTDRRWRRRQEAKIEEEERAEAPAKELTGVSVAAETVARAAAALLQPLQQTISGLQSEVGGLREAVTVSRTAEETCKAELAQVREKLREVTDRLGIAPNGGGSSAEDHPNRRSTD